MRRSVILLVLILTLGLSACGDVDEATAPSGEAMPVALETAGEAAQPQVFRYTGTVQGVRRVPLSTKLMGRVTQLPVDEGDRVRRGQLLLRLDSDDVEAQQRQVQARLREARAHLDNARTNFERFETLYQQESATKKEFEDVQTRYESAQARVEALENRLAEIADMLSYATLTAPVDGYVVQKRIEEGAMAAPGQPLLVVETLDAMKVDVQVPEQDINRFEVGDEVDVEVAALETTVPGRVDEVNPSGNPASRQFQVQVVLARDGPPIKSGMYAQVQLRKGEETTLTVPAEALVRRGQLTGLYTVGAEDRAVLRWVRTGQRYDGRIEVLSGLRAGERYVARVDARLQEGQRVTAQTPTARN
jgi:RND family efflux transporter MFP subunit